MKAESFESSARERPLGALEAAGNSAGLGRTGGRGPVGNLGPTENCPLLPPPRDYFHLPLSNSSCQ